eukprot:scaffold12832_cov50-Attheya_sp.AAC.4
MFAAMPWSSTNEQGGASGQMTTTAVGGPGGLNEKLNTDYLDIAEDDNSWSAAMTRGIAGFVGKFCTPRQILIALRLLKAVTFCFLLLTIFADVMYIFFVELMVSDEVNENLGGHRDIVIRFYGLFMAIVAVLLELDVAIAFKYFPGLKGFVPRGFLLFFIATVTNAHPLHSNASDSSAQTDDAYAADDDYAAAGDDRYIIAKEIPNSSVAFQMVTSFILAICALVYVCLGILCFDRFTSKAFLSQKDPVVTTAIPQPPTPESGMGHYESP